MPPQGLEPVMQMTTRDRNRIAIQADILGAAAFDIHNCLCIAGDHQSFSAAGRLKGHPGAKNVYDIDSIQLVGMLKKMRDEGLQLGGDPLEVAPKLYIGAAWTPMADPYESARLPPEEGRPGPTSSRPRASTTRSTSAEDEEDARNGHAREDPHPGRHHRAQERGDAALHGHVRGRRARAEGTHQAIPAHQEGRLEEKKARQLQELGNKIAVELIQQVLETEGVHGVHIQAIEWESAVRDREGRRPVPAAGCVKQGQGSRKSGETNMPKITILDIYKKKAEGKKITMLTAYDYPTAQIVDQAGIDMILVGDSLGMVVLGERSPCRSRWTR